MAFWIKRNIILKLPFYLPEDYSKTKGYLLLLEAYAILKKKYANIELKIAGEGPLEEEIRKQKEVILLGKLEHEDMMKCYKKADIFI